jgi:hypothetical protein
MTSSLSELNANTVAAAAGAGHLDVLRWPVLVFTHHHLIVASSSHHHLT